MNRNVDSNDSRRSQVVESAISTARLRGLGAHGVARVQEGIKRAASVDLEILLLRRRSNLEFCVVCIKCLCSDQRHGDNSCRKVGCNSRKCEGSEQRQ